MPSNKPITITKPERHTAPIKVTAADLLGPGVVACPNPRMPLWCNHPKVYIDVGKTGSGRCPYCGAVYVLEGHQAGGAVRGH